MPISKEKKNEVLGKLKTVVAAKSLALVNFHGLTVANVTEFRRALKASGVSYFVSKKTLAKKALGEAGISGTLPDLPGELGIAYSDDLLAPARETFTFQKKFENKVSLQGGVFEGRFMTADEMKALALIPTMQTLRAQFVNLINSPIQGFVMALDAIAKKKIS
ncbi:MAG: 50S ribosomal protein L10 [Candidatus Zambryskibacteria bacterium]|nr:50S ribosomal protein L10 [Candidatus Zambryskibacteria bacterium]